MHPFATVYGVDCVERNYTYGIELLLEPFINMKLRGYKDMKYHQEECKYGDTCYAKNIVAAFASDINIIFDDE